MKTQRIIKKSLAIEEKLTNRFAPSPIVAEFDTLLSTAENPHSFRNKHELEDYLSEGALLSLNTLGSKALSIPCGEYMVWTTDNGNTMLVPTELQQSSEEVFEAHKNEYEVLTPDLLANYSGVGRAILEADASQDQSMDSGEDSDNGGGDGGEDSGGGHGFKSTIQMKSVDRNPMARAMQQQGWTVTSLADACGVDPPAISRILRIPKNTVGDPKGRNPSIGLAAKISHALSMDAEALFPDIFNVPKQKLKARQTPGNRGSGMAGAASGSARKGKATAKWTQGSQGIAQNEGRVVGASEFATFAQLEHLARKLAEETEEEGDDEVEEIRGVRPDADGVYRNVPGTSLNFSLKKPAKPNKPEK